MDWVRKQILLTPEQAEELRRLAYETKLSEAEHIRRALEKYLQEEKE